MGSIHRYLDILGSIIPICLNALLFLNSWASSRLRPYLSAAYVVFTQARKLEAASGNGDFEKIGNFPLKLHSSAKLLDPHCVRICGVRINSRSLSCKMINYGNLCSQTIGFNLGLSFYYRRPQLTNTRQR